MHKVNHSELRHRILSSLKLAPAVSVTALAQELGVLRPSVSRAVKSLEDAGLVTRSGRKIILSPSGQAELRRLDNTLATKVLKDAEAATRVFGQAFEASNEFHALTQQFDDVARSIGAYVDSSALRAFEALSSLSSLQSFATVNDSAAMQVAEWIKNDPAAKLVETIKDNPALQMAESITKSTALLAKDAFIKTAAIQATNLDLFKSWKVAVPSPLSDLISSNNLALGTIVSDLEAFTKIGTVADMALGGLVDQTLWTAKVYDGYFADTVKSVSVTTTLDDLKVSVALPTQSMASLVGTTRSIVKAEIGIPGAIEPSRSAHSSPPAYSSQHQEAKTTIEIYLELLGQRFVYKWQGAWQAFHSDSQDRHSQAAHSGRELLIQVLAYLAPDNVFTAEELARRKVNKPTRTMRIEYILKDQHSKTVELITNFAKTLDSMYDVLVGEAHRRDEKDLPDDTFASMLQVLENLLIMLLSMRKNLS